MSLPIPTLQSLISQHRNKLSKLNTRRTNYKELRNDYAKASNLQLEFLWHNSYKRASLEISKVEIAQKQLKRELSSRIAEDAVHRRVKKVYEEAREKAMERAGEGY